MLLQEANSCAHGHKNGYALCEGWYYDPLWYFGMKLVKPVFLYFFAFRH